MSLQWTEISTFVEKLLSRGNTHQVDDREKTKYSRQSFLCYELMSALAKKLGLECIFFKNLIPLSQKLLSGSWGHSKHKVNAVEWVLRACGCSRKVDWNSSRMLLEQKIMPLRKAEKNQNAYEKIQQSKTKCLLRFKNSLTSISRRQQDKILEYFYMFIKWF